MSAGVCVRCDYQPCRVPDWARDGSWYSNNPGKFDQAVSHNHGWFAPARLAEVERVQAETRAMIKAPTYPCVDCGRHAFPAADVVCFWCKRGRVLEVAA